MLFFCYCYTIFYLLLLFSNDGRYSINYIMYYQLSTQCPPTIYHIKYLYIDFLCDNYFVPKHVFFYFSNKKVSRIVHVIKHPNNESLIEWRESNEVKEAILAKERNWKPLFQYMCCKGRTKLWSSSGKTKMDKRWTTIQKGTKYWIRVVQEELSKKQSENEGWTYWRWMKN